MEDDTATYLSQTYQPTLFGNNNSKWQFRFELLNTDPVLKIIEYIERNMAIDNNTQVFMMFEIGNITITIKDLHNLWAYRFKFPTTIHDLNEDFTQTDDDLPLILSMQFEPFKSNMQKINHSEKFEIKIPDIKCDKIVFYQEQIKTLKYAHQLCPNLRQTPLKTEYTGEIIPTLTDEKDEVYEVYDKNKTQIQTKYKLKITMAFADMNNILDMLGIFKKEKVVFKYSKKRGFMMFIKEEATSDHNAIAIKFDEQKYKAELPTELGEKGLEFKYDITRLISITNFLHANQTVVMTFGSESFLQIETTINTVTTGQGQEINPSIYSLILAPHNQFDNQSCK